MLQDPTLDNPLEMAGATSLHESLTRVCMFLGGPALDAINALHLDAMVEYEEAYLAYSTERNDDTTEAFGAATATTAKVYRLLQAVTEAALRLDDAIAVYELDAAVPDSGF